jgi:hypothetical protein
MTVQNHFAILAWQAGAHPWALGEDDDVCATAHTSIHSFRQTA